MYFVAGGEIALCFFFLCRVAHSVLFGLRFEGEERRMHYFYQEDFDVDSLDAVIQKYKTGVNMPQLNFGCECGERCFAHSVRS